MNIPTNKSLDFIASISRCFRWKNEYHAKVVDFLFFFLNFQETKGNENAVPLNVSKIPMFRHMEAEEHQTESPLTKVKIELPNLPTEDMGEPTDTATAHFF